jgi:hypothetical protein
VAGRVGKTGITFTVRITGIRETLAKFRDLPKDASAALRTETLKLSQAIADAAQRAGRSQGGQAALVARTVKARKDRVPSVQAGGATPLLGRYRKPPFTLLFGSEFGMSQHSGWYRRSSYRHSVGFQYHAHSGQTGAWFFPTVEKEAPRIDQAWNAVADKVLRDFGGE